MSQLNDLVSIRTGYTFRSPPEPAPDGAYRALMMRDVSPGTGIDTESMIRFHWEAQSTPSTIEAGDVLLISRAPRTSQFYAVLVPSGLENVVASSHFYILQVRSPRITPEFLHCYLNSLVAQKHLAAMAAGTQMPHLSVSTLKELPVEVPDPETQQKIVALHDLFLKEEDLTRQLMEKRQTLRELILTQLLTERIKP